MPENTSLSTIKLINLLVLKPDFSHFIVSLAFNLSAMYHFTYFASHIYLHSSNSNSFLSPYHTNHIYFHFMTKLLFVSEFAFHVHAD